MLLLDIGVHYVITLKSTVQEERKKKSLQILIISLLIWLVKKLKSAVTELVIMGRKLNIYSVSVTHSYFQVRTSSSWWLQIEESFKKLLLFIHVILTLINLWGYKKIYTRDIFILVFQATFSSNNGLRRIYYNDYRK